MMSRAQGVRERRALLMSIAADHRRAARAKILDLKARVREAQALRRGALLNLPAKCRAERLLVREKIRSNRLRALARLRRQARRDMTRVPRNAVPRWEPPPAASAASDVPF